MVKPCAWYASFNRCIQGNDCLQGRHHDAQKSRYTTRPRRLAISTGESARAAARTVQQRKAAKVNERMGSRCATLSRKVIACQARPPPPLALAGREYDPRS